MALRRFFMEFCNIERLIPKLESRKAIPIFELSLNKGKTINLWDFKQLKNLLIIFHHGSQCSICRNKLRKIAKVYSELRKLETEVLAVSTESLEKVKEQAKKMLFLSTCSQTPLERQLRFTLTSMKQEMVLFPQFSSPTAMVNCENKK